MKKKIALLLAAVMTLSAVPTLGLFAASTNSINGVDNLPVKTLAVQVPISPQRVTNGGNIDVEYVTNAPVFIAKLADSSSSNINADPLAGALNNKFELTLNGNSTEWFFAGGTTINNIIGSEYTFKRTPYTTSAAKPASVIALAGAIATASALTVTSGNVQQSELDALKLAYADVTAAADAITESNTDINAYKAAAKALAASVANASLTTIEGIIAPANISAVTDLEAAATISTDVPNPTGTDFSFDPKEYVTKDHYTFYTRLEVYKGSVHYATIEVNEANRETAIITMAVSVPQNTEISFPVVFRTGDVEEDITIRPYGSVLSNVSQTINKVTATAGTSTTVKSVKTGRDKIELDTITIAESSAGIIKSGGATTLSINDDFQWVVAGTEISFTGGFSTSSVTLSRVANNNYNFYGKTGSVEVDAYLNADKTELTLIISGISASSLRGSIVIKKLTVEPNEDAINAGYYGQSVTMKIKEVGSYKWVDPVDNKEKTASSIKSGVKEQTGIKVAEFVDYGLKLTFDAGDNAKVVEAYSGKKEIKAGVKGDDVAKIVLEELTTDSWWATRALDITLTDADGKLLDGVKFLTFEVTDKDKVEIATREVKTKGTDTSTDGSAIKFERQKVSVTAGKAINPGDKGKIKFTVTFNASANFVGDVYVNVGGSGTKDTPDMRIKVATITAPIKVDTKSTNVAIGYQSYAVGDITVTENAAGVLAKNKTIDFTVREFADVTSRSSSDIYFNPIKNDTLKVTSGDITFSKIKLEDGSVKAEVGKESKTASTFTLSGLQVKIYRDAPYGTYDLVVGGDAWVETYNPKYSELKKNDDDFAQFDIEGRVVKGYVDITTPPSTATISRNVVVVIGTNTAMVDGKEVDMGISTYIDPASNRTMLPLRAVAMLFGISDNNVNWDPATGKAVIIIGERIVTFTNGSSKMAINNIEFEMADENGVSVKAAINPENDRMYIPLRQLGIAYGVDVLWVDSTPGLAIFNPTAEQKEEAANASSAAPVETPADDETPAEEVPAEEAPADEETTA